MDRWDVSMQCGATATVTSTTSNAVIYLLSTRDVAHCPFKGENYHDGRWTYHNVMLVECSSLIRKDSFYSVIRYL